MKFWQKLLISVSVVIVAISGLLILNYRRGSNPVINVETKFLVKKVDDKFNIIKDCGINIDNSDEKPYFISGNIKILTVELLTGNTECISSGRADIIVNLRLDENITIKQNIHVEVKEKPHFATYASFEKQEIFLSSNLNESENKLITDALNVNIDVSYKNSIVEYDYVTGKVITKGIVGSDIVIVKIPTSETEFLEISFNVEIGPKNIKTLEYNLNAGDVIKIDFGLLLIEKHLNGLENFTIENSLIADIVEVDFDKIIIKALKSGLTSISYKDTLNEINLLINIS